MCSSGLCIVLFLLFIIDEAWFLENGLARTPPMGWMSWGYYMCADKCTANPDKCLDEKLILSVADAFFKNGYQEAGYEYIIIDDCWSERTRIKGRLVPDRKRFPRGMKFIADYIHSRGLKFGMYINIAEVTCMQYPGSRGYFHEDSKRFAEWDVDYIKVDGCFVTEEYLDVAYIKLGRHLNKTGRPMVYSCSWPYYKEFINKKKPNYTAIAPHCNMWRNYHDVFLNWPSVEGIIRHYERSYEELHKHHGPGHWNDPDMLIFGTNVLKPNQARIQLAVYAMLSAPLLLSCNMGLISNYERSLLLNLDLIAIAQDPLGIMAKPHSLAKDITLWVKPRLPMKGDSYLSYSFALVNLKENSEFVSISPKAYGLNSTDSYTVMDVFSGEFLRNITLKDTFEVISPPNDVLWYTLFPL